MNRLVDLKALSRREPFLAELQLIRFLTSLANQMDPKVPCVQKCFIRYFTGINIFSWIWSLKCFVCKQLQDGIQADHQNGKFYLFLCYYRHKMKIASKMLTTIEMFIYLLRHDTRRHPRWSPQWELIFILLKRNEMKMAFKMGTIIVNYIIFRYGTHYMKMESKIVIKM